MLKQEGGMMLKRATCGWVGSAEVNATLKMTVKKLTPYAAPARLIVLLTVLAFVGSALAATTASAAEPEAAERTFQAHCAGCHGQDGSGNTAIGKSVGIPDVRAADVQKQSDTHLAELIANGTSKMPPFKNSLNSEQIYAVVGYVRALARKP